MADDDEWTNVIAADEVPDGQVVGVTISDHNIAIYNVDGVFHATSNICTHEYAELADGILEDCIIECPLHAGQFDIRTGKGLCEPIEQDLPVYECKVEDGEIFVKLPD
jgi:naphthalene 1,2-dioxygenase ferredoxin component